MRGIEKELARERDSLNTFLSNSLEDHNKKSDEYCRKYLSATMQISSKRLRVRYSLDRKVAINF